MPVKEAKLVLLHARKVAGLLVMKLCRVFVCKCKFLTLIITHFLNNYKHSQIQQWSDYALN